MALRDHGGGLDAAAKRFGGLRADWLDLSTGINPVAYPVGDIDAKSWTSLPDAGAMARLLDAARGFWVVPDAASIVAAPGASAIIARVPYLTADGGTAHVPQPTYNEHAAALATSGRWTLAGNPEGASLHVHVHPNNPDGRLWQAQGLGRGTLTVIDESFCDVSPERSHIALAGTDGILILKSFGKFWGLAGMRLGFAIGTPATLRGMQDQLGPWAVSGPALDIATRALSDGAWATTTRLRLARWSARLDLLMAGHGAEIVGGTTLFRLYDVGNAVHWQDRLAAHHIWSRVFPYNPRWLRLGLPDPDGWARLQEALR